jgi:hypothetical protein
MIKNYVTWLNEDFKPGYAKSDYSRGLPPLEMEKPTSAIDWIKWFQARADQLKKAHSRSEKVREGHRDNVIPKAMSLISGEVERLPYTDMYTSTAGFQWGKEFLDILAHDGLFKVVKDGNKVYAELAVPDDVKKEMHHIYRGHVAGKRFNV